MNKKSLVDCMSARFFYAFSLRCVGNIDSNWCSSQKGENIKVKDTFCIDIPL